jgi:hypothetical protein
MAAAITLLAVAPLTLALSQEPSRQPERKALRLTRDVLTTGIVNREPIDSATVFAPSVGALYYFTELEGASPAARIVHIWYYRDEKMAEFPLAVEALRWRTWSRKQILQNQIGPWKVEAVGPDGTVLSSRTFAVH